MRRPKEIDGDAGNRLSHQHSDADFTGDPGSCCVSSKSSGRNAYPDFLTTSRQPLAAFRAIHDATEDAHGRRSLGRAAPSKTPTSTSVRISSEPPPEDPPGELGVGIVGGGGVGGFGSTIVTSQVSVAEAFAAFRVVTVTM
jgi:hypothetical protein